jgi:hypothetical protein
VADFDGTIVCPVKLVAPNSRFRFGYFYGHGHGHISCGTNADHVRSHGKQTVNRLRRPSVGQITIFLVIILNIELMVICKYLVFPFHLSSRITLLHRSQKSCLAALDLFAQHLQLEPFGLGGVEIGLRLGERG